MKTLPIFALALSLSSAFAQSQHPLVALERIDASYAHTVLHFAGQCGLDPDPQLFRGVSTEPHFIAVKKIYEALANQKSPGTTIRLPNVVVVPDFCKQVLASANTGSSSATAQAAPTAPTAQSTASNQAGPAPNQIIANAMQSVSMLRRHVLFGVRPT
jgi:hypothetical protein